MCVVFFCAYYLNPASLLNLTHETVDRLFNAYQIYLPRKVDFVDEDECWKLRWTLVDEKSERLLDTLYMQQIATYTRLCLTDNAGSIGNKREIFQYNWTHEILLNVDYWR